MNDVAGMIEDVEEMAFLVPQILTQMVERAVDMPQISNEKTDSAHAASHRTGRRVSHIQCPSCKQWTVQVPQVMTHEVRSVKFQCQ